jgi:choline-glycine betaine transporter
MHVLANLVHVDAVITLAIWVFFLFHLVWGGYGPVRTGPGSEKPVYGSLVPFLFFLFVVVVAFIAWIMLVFA